MYMMLHPLATLTQTARELGYTIGWLSQIINCDLFQARLASLRQQEVEVCVLSLREKTAAVAYQGLERLGVKLDTEENTQVIGDVTTKLLKNLGHGAEDPPSQHISNTLIVATKEGMEEARGLMKQVKALTNPLPPTDDLVNRIEKSGGRIIEHPPTD